MELSNLAPKQKRIKAWTDFLNEHRPHLPEELNALYSDTLKEYRNSIARCWEDGEVSVAHTEAISNLERRMEQLNEEARLIVVPG